MYARAARARRARARMARVPAPSDVGVSTASVASTNLGQNLSAIIPQTGRIAGLGLDSSERGNPPGKFQRLFAAAGAAGLKLVAHAGEEGPADYVADAVDLLKIDRIDHGNRALEDPVLVHRLAERGIAFTVCPLSNLRLGGVATLEQHPLKRMLSAGLKATVNSDDPAYFGGYLLDNFVAVADALELSEAELVSLVRNSIVGSFLGEPEKRKFLRQIDESLSDAG